MPLENGDYKVWVQTTLNNGRRVWGPAVSFTVDVPLTDFSTVPLSPDGPGFDTWPEFTWQQTDGATSYNVYLHDGTNAILHTDITGTSLTLSTPITGTWTWWVQVVDTANGVGPWSRPLTFNTTGQTNLLTPTPSTTNATPIFTWQAVNGVVRYSLQVSNLTTGENRVIHEDSLTTTSFTPSQPLSPGLYRAWVQAIGSDNLSSHWTQLDFVIVAAQTADENPEVTNDLLTTTEQLLLNESTAVSGPSARLETHAAESSTRQVGEQVAALVANTGVDHVETVDTAEVADDLMAAWVSNGHWLETAPLFR